MKLSAKLKKIKHYIVILAAVLIIIFSSMYITSKDEGFDPTMDAWYEVEPWEVEVCSKWGGSSEPQTYSSSSKIFTGITTHMEVVTLQGQKTTYNISGNQSNVYEVSWYYQPLKGSESYKVYFAKGSIKKEIYKGTATAQGDGSYYAESFDTDPNYTTVVIEYSGKTLSTPIQKKEG